MALRNAKIAYNFGLSECNRVKRTVFASVMAECFLTLLHSEMPKLHTVLAFLSAIGLIGQY